MSFKDARQAFLAVRCEDISERLANSPEYKQLFSEKNELLNSLKVKLAPEDRKLLLKLDEAEAVLASLSEDVFYEAGLSDGVQIAQGLLLFTGPGRIRREENHA